LTETLIVMLSVPFALVGGVWLMWLLDYNLSVAVVVGFIALAGVAAETGVIMLIYLDHAWQRSRRSAARPGANPPVGDLYEAVMDGRRRARAAEDDDRRGDHGRSAADPVGSRQWLGGDEPDRRADGRRHALFDGADAGGDSGDLCAGQAMVTAAGKRAISGGISAQGENDVQDEACPFTATVVATR
jgi:hypothetical protein